MVPVMVVKQKPIVQKTVHQVQIVQLVTLIGQLMALNAVILHGLSME
jgi:hypothetical protein